MFFSPETFKENTVNRLLVRQHPEYPALKLHWGFLEASYRGGPEWLKGNIFRYMKEGDKEYKDRVERSYRFNHTREVVDLVNKYLFRVGPKRNTDDASPSLSKFWKKSTMNGMSMNEFSREISLQSSIFGRVWVVVDSTTNPDVITVADEKNSVEDQTYAYIVKPKDVLDMSYDDYGILNWILIRETIRDDTDPFLGTGRVLPRYRLWTRQQWFLFEPQMDTLREFDVGNIYELVADGVHDLGIVPVIPADNVVSYELYSSPSLVADVAYLDRACANYASNLDAIIQDQTFSQLALPAQGLLPGDDEYKKLLELGTKRIFIYDGESGAQPFFLSPDPRQATLISEAIGQIIGEIYHSVGLGNERSKDVATDSTDKVSGVAKSKDFERVSALLKSKSDAMELTENRIMDLVLKWSGKESPQERLVKYPTSFDTRELIDEFYVASQLSLIQMPPTVRAEQMKNIVGKLFPKTGQSVKAQMISDIESWTKREELLNETNQGLSDGTTATTPEQSKLIEEAKRNRTVAGAKQSASKEKTSDSKKTAI